MAAHHSSLSLTRRKQAKVADIEGAGVVKEQCVTLSNLFFLRLMALYCER